MNRINIIVFVFLCLAYVARSNLEENFPTNPSKQKHIFQLDSGNYVAKFKKTEHIFVFFYSPFCKYSIPLSEEYLKASLFFNNFNYITKFTLAQFNVNSDKEAASKLKVEGTPSIRYYHKGIFQSTYEGNRTSVGVYNFVLRSLGLISTEISGMNQLEGFNLFSNASLIYVGKTEGLDEFKKSVSMLQDELMIGNIDNSSKHNIEIIDKYGNDKILLFHHQALKASHAPFHIDNEKSFKNVENFISFNLYDRIMDFNEQTSKLIFSQGKAGLFFYVSPKEHQKYHDFISENLPTSVREKMIIFLLGNEKNENYEGRLYSIVGVTHNDFPTVKIHQFNKSLNTETMKGEITSENIISFLENWYTNGFTTVIPIKDDL